MSVKSIVNADYMEAYKAFMYDPKNIMNCVDCPENILLSDKYRDGLPCGQQHCWVSCHCGEASQ